MAVVLAKAKVVRMASITMNELTLGDPQIAVSPTTNHQPWKKGGLGSFGWLVLQEAMRGPRCWFCFDDPDLIHLRPQMGDGQITRK